MNAVLLSALPLTKFLDVSVVLPCLDEARTLEACILQIQHVFVEAGISGEIIVADNGSCDDSPEIATKLGARVVHIRATGYGNALSGGIAAARGKYVVMGDSDESYDFGQIPEFLEQLREGSDLVVGNRFKGGVQRKAMPLLHRYLGNPALTHLGKLFFDSPCGDFNCGLRGFSKTAYDQLGLRTTGMEFATEMIVRATLLKMRITEVPTILSPDGRNRPSHLRTWHDGWRHLRFLLLCSPRWLFLYPGIASMLIGCVAGGGLLAGSRRITGIEFDVSTLLYAAVAVLLGFQSVAFAVLSKVFAIAEGLHPPDARLDRLFRYLTLEVGLLAGAVLTFFGLGISIYALRFWGNHQFGPLNASHTLRLVIPAMLSLILGAQIVFSSFFLSLLRLHRR